MTDHDAHVPPVHPDSLPRTIIEELAAIGAAIGSNCEPCLTFHHDRARGLGFSNDQLAVAVAMAQRVKNAPAAKILDLAARLLDVDVQTLENKPRG